MGGWVSGGGRLFAPTLALSGGCPLCHDRSAPCGLWPELRGGERKIFAVLEVPRARTAFSCGNGHGGTKLKTSLFSQDF